MLRSLNARATVVSLLFLAVLLGLWEINSHAPAESTANRNMNC